MKKEYIFPYILGIFASLIPVNIMVEVDSWKERVFFSLVSVVVCMIIMFVSQKLRIWGVDEK